MSPTRVVVDDDEQQIADLIKQMRRLRGRLATGQVHGTHDEFTAAATPETTYTLTYLPVDGTCAMFNNGLEQTEDDDYSVDYDTGVVTFDTALTTGDEVDFRYLITDWLVARSLPPDEGTGPGVFVAGAGTGNSSSTASVTVPGGLAAGDLLIFSLVLFNTISGQAGPSGFTLEGKDTKLGVWWKIADGTETTVSTALGGSLGWAATVQIYRGTNIRVESSAFGPAASTSTSCTLPTASVSGEPLAVEIWGGCRTGGSPVGITPPAGPVNVTSGTTGGRAVSAGSQALTGVSTTPADIATASLADDGWGAAVLTVAIDL